MNDENQGHLWDGTPMAALQHRITNGNDMPTNHDETLLERYQREHRVYEGISMSEHTKGKLELESKGWNGQVIYGNDDRAMGGRRFIAEVSLYHDGAEANARRLVACWNWCDGLSTENLEDNIPAIELARRYNEVIRERDRLSAINAELLEALKAMKHKLRLDDPLDMYDSVCAAIAKAQGEQP